MGADGLGGGRDGRPDLGALVSSPGRRASWWRLWSIQGSFAPDARQWLGWIVALDGFRAPDPERPETAWVDDEPRTLNTNPHFVGVLLGARVGVEESVGGADGRAMARTVTEVLPSTLGALGDRLVWTGLRPALVAVAAALAPWAGAWPAVGAWLLFAVAQGWFRSWSFGWARRQGAGVATALGRLPLHAITEIARVVGAVGIGVLTATLLVGARDVDPSTAAVAVGVGFVAAWRRVDPVWALLAIALAVGGVAALREGLG